MADLPYLAELNRLAYMHETAAMFAFTNWPAEKEMYQFFLSNLRGLLQDSKTQVFKALSAASGEILGFAGFTLVEGVQDKQALAQPAPDPTEAAIQNEPLGLNMDFMNVCARKIERLKGYMKGQKHYCM